MDITCRHMIPLQVPHRSVVNVLIYQPTGSITITDVNDMFMGVCFIHMDVDHKTTDI